jgi:diaminohydroxyphosphoribosylaminopyrimidine deaminase (EC 3.5.4.26)/5-amino-6-(5-phosphoribosylamino)uracil reductase (EC 1.1.1.193)
MENNRNFTQEEIYMARCVELARKGKCEASPNPMVGAVIVCDGKIIGEGYHRICGDAHAEVNAINSVKDKSKLKQSTIYVSLEPCSHYGKTPPCADLIIEKEIPKVVIGCIDPFAKVAGRGIKKLQDAGIKVTVGVLEQECSNLNKRFITFHSKKRPYIILKWAESSDGFLDVKRTGGNPVALSTPMTNMLVHKRRAEVDAIIVGTRTALLDNPTLSVRNWYGKIRSGL